MFGVEIVSEATLVITKTSKIFNWDGFGLSIRIRGSSLPDSVEKCTISIMASLSGQYTFPKNSHLVSIIYWLRCEPRCKFQRPIIVSIQHCAKSGNTSKLSFVRAFCTQKKLPYAFEQLEGNFTSYSSYGVIELDSFSGLGITQEGSDAREYCASLYRKTTSSGDFCHIVVMDFVIMWNIEAHINVS